MDRNGEMCESNDDCPIGQYCYTSNRCVNYIDCNRYNRLEGLTEAQTPSQCGPCMKGYASEHLTSNVTSSICKYIENQAGSGINHKLIILSTVISLLTVIVIVVLYFFKHQQIRRFISNYIGNNSNATVIDSAPPQEQNPFIKCDEKKCCTLDNNNKKITESNEFQNSIPCTIQYRPIDAYAPAHSNFNININTNPNNNPLSREVAIIDMPNDRDTEILQSDLSNDDNLPNYNDDDNDTIDSGTEPKDEGDQKTANLFISQQATQNITINLNG